MEEESIKSVIVGSTNITKIKAVRDVLEPLGYLVSGKHADSFVSNQPKSDEETIKGAINRALNLKEGFLRIGLEAGVDVQDGIMFLVNWGALIDPEDNVFVAGGTRIPLPKEVEKLINEGYELKDAMDSFYNEHDINIRCGAIGYFTDNFVERTEIFTHITKLLYGQYSYFMKKGVH